MPAMTTPATCLDLLRQMVRIDSINGTLSGRSRPEELLALYLEQVARGWGLATERCPAGVDGSWNLLITHQVAAQAPWLLFESHLDTVGVEQMTIDPWAATVEAGRLYGRGACDTKGSGAAMLWALQDYARSGTGAHNVTLLFVVDEEATKTGINAFVGQHLPALGWRPLGGIVGEPTSLRPVVASCGVVRWSIRTHGLAAHSSDPTRGRSAIRMMMQVLAALDERYIARMEASHPLTGPARCSVNLIRGGNAVNIIPELCEVWVDRRVTPGEEPLDVLPTVRRLLDGLQAEQPELAYSLSEPFIDRPLSPSADPTWLQAVQRALAQHGLPATPQGVGYGSNASTLADAGIPVVLLGPGDIAQAHAADEFLELEQLAVAVDVYATLMMAPWEADA